MDFIQDQIQRAVFFFFGEIDFSVFNGAQVFADILLVSAIIYLILRSIERIHASQVLISVLFLGILIYLAQTFNLIASKVILIGVFLLLLISIPFTFQYEIRFLFDRIGRSPFMIFRKENVSARHKTLKAVKHASVILATKKHGALIVIEKVSPLQTYAETGVLLNAEVTKELLLNIFFPKSPLHDGAVIIRRNKVVSSGAVLPFTHNTPDYMYGTRHKSALGLSEVTDAIVIVISEERGEISIARNGEFMPNIGEKELEEYLNKEM